MIVKVDDCQMIVKGQGYCQSGWLSKWMVVKGQDCCQDDSQKWMVVKVDGCQSGWLSKWMVVKVVVKVVKMVVKGQGYCQSGWLSGLLSKWSRW